MDLVFSLKDTYGGGPSQSSLEERRHNIILAGWMSLAKVSFTPKFVILLLRYAKIIHQ